MKIAIAMKPIVAIAMPLAHKKKLDAKGACQLFSGVEQGPRATEHPT
jgi:hypothetical protein